MSEMPILDPVLHSLALMAPAGYFIGLHIRYASPLMQFSNYNQDWLDHYTEKAFALRDPTIAWGFSTEGACRWSEIDIPDPFGLFREAKEFGLKFGLTVSCGPVRSRTISSFARADRDFTDSEIEKISELVRRLHDITEPPESLTTAQIEALKLIAAGDRHAAAAAKLKISESALKARLMSARQKLLARTTAEAIQRAKDYRLM
ncbi:autoinducer binding domain-containing protein [Defluviimonas sp. WL0024]|uniref:Autoinducer binding domain-containing protein n=2 Tax=Albidovulum TaxID=205889 RepID=A0ABT3IYU2_9RHOB|nr:autoinducer binding domain-containing protein [Defluviimonas sp. WL0024]MCW3780602.1 autoinducer binding domain-containing protein [Defluviimonas salinarum]